MDEPSTSSTEDPFTTQPTIQIQDIYGNLITSSTATVTATITTDTGNPTASLSGTTTENAVAGITTF